MASSSSGRAQTSTKPEILTLIKQDHDKTKQLFQQFEQRMRSSPQQAATLGKQILDDLNLHAQLEEQIIYPWLKRQNEKLFYEAEEEHHVAKLLIAELERMGVQDPSYEAKMMVLRENVVNHMEEEESQMFEQIEALPRETLNQVSTDWKARKGESA